MTAANIAAPAPRYYETGLVALLMLFWGCVGLNRVGIGVIFPQIIPEFHMQKWQASLLIAGTSVTWAFSSWIGGWLSDRYGRRRVLLPAAAFVAVMTAAMGLTVGFWSMFLVRDLLGVGDVVCQWVGVYPPARTLIHALFEEHRVGVGFRSRIGRDGNSFFPRRHAGRMRTVANFTWHLGLLTNA